MYIKFLTLCIGVLVFAGALQASQEEALKGLTHKKRKLDRSEQDSFKLNKEKRLLKHRSHITIKKSRNLTIRGQIPSDAEIGDTYAYKCYLNLHCSDFPLYFSFHFKKSKDRTFNIFVVSNKGSNFMSDNYARANLKKIQEFKPKLSLVDYKCSISFDENGTIKDFNYAKTPPILYFKMSNKAKVLYPIRLDFGDVGSLDGVVMTNECNFPPLDKTD